MCKLDRSNNICTYTITAVFDTYVFGTCAGLLCHSGHWFLWSSFMNYTQSDYSMPLEWFQQVATANVPASLAPPYRKGLGTKLPVARDWWTDFIETHEKDIIIYWILMYVCYLNTFHDTEDLKENLLSIFQVWADLDDLDLFDNTIEMFNFLDTTDHWL